MTCPYLWGTYLHSCSASDDVYIPDSGTLRLACSAGPGNHFSRCPHFQRASLYPLRGQTENEQQPLPPLAIR